MIFLVVVLKAVKKSLCLHREPRAVQNLHKNNDLSKGMFFKWKQNFINFTELAECRRSDNHRSMNYLVSYLYELMV